MNKDGNYEKKIHMVSSDALPIPYFILNITVVLNKTNQLL